jgi:20S proteasome alpha/beta subunit
MMKTVIYPIKIKHRYLKVKPMTLIVALKCKDGVVIASDGRIIIADEYREAQKIHKISRCLIVGAAGSVGVTEKVVERLNGVNGTLNNVSDRNLIEERINEVYRRHTSLYGQAYSSREEFESVFGGEMLVCDTNAIYKFFMNGYPEPCSDYECAGSARPYGLSILRDFYERDLEMERAKELAVYVILQAMQISRDVGEPIQMAVLPNNSEASVLPNNEVREVVERINGRQQFLREIWKLISKDPDKKKALQELIKQS